MIQMPLNDSEAILNDFAQVFDAKRFKDFNPHVLCALQVFKPKQVPDHSGRPDRPIGMIVRWF